MNHAKVFLVCPFDRGGCYEELRSCQNQESAVGYGWCQWPRSEGSWSGRSHGQVVGWSQDSGGLLQRAEVAEAGCGNVQGHFRQRWAASGAGPALVGHRRELRDHHRLRRPGLLSGVVAGDGVS